MNKTKLTGAQIGVRRVIPFSHMGQRFWQPLVCDGINDLGTISPTVNFTGIPHVCLEILFELNTVGYSATNYPLVTSGVSGYFSVVANTTGTNWTLFLGAGSATWTLTTKDVLELNTPYHVILNFYYRGLNNEFNPSGTFPVAEFFINGQYAGSAVNTNAGESNFFTPTYFASDNSTLFTPCKIYFTRFFAYPDGALTNPRQKIDVNVQYNMGRFNVPQMVNRTEPNLATPKTQFYEFPNLYNVYNTMTQTQNITLSGGAYVEGSAP
jgi:hypothetical protein